MGLIAGSKEVTLYDSAEATGCDDVGLRVNGKYVVTSPNRGAVATKMKANGNTVYTEWTQYTIRMPPLAFQNITLQYNHLGKTYTVVSPNNGEDSLTFNVYRGDSWTATLDVQPHFILQDTTFPKSGTFDKDILFTAVSPIRDSHTVTIIQSPNQTITVQNNTTGEIYTKTFVEKHPTSLKALITAATGYNPGTLTPDKAWTLVDDITVSATPATLKSYNLVYPMTIGQTLNVYVNGALVYSGKDGGSVKVNHFDTVTASLVADTDYTAGTVSGTGTVSGAMTLSVSSATYNPPAPSHQTQTIEVPCYIPMSDDGNGFETETVTATLDGSPITIEMSGYFEADESSDTAEFMIGLSGIPSAYRAIRVQYWRQSGGEWSTWASHTLSKRKDGTWGNTETDARNWRQYRLDAVNQAYKLVITFTV